MGCIFFCKKVENKTSPADSVKTAVKKSQRKKQRKKRRNVRHDSSLRREAQLQSSDSSSDESYTKTSGSNQTIRLQNEDDDETRSNERAKLLLKVAVPTALPQDSALKCRSSSGSRDFLKTHLEESREGCNDREKNSAGCSIRRNSLSNNSSDSQGYLARKLQKSLQDKAEKESESSSEKIEDNFLEARKIRAIQGKDEGLVNINRPQKDSEIDKACSQRESLFSSETDLEIDQTYYADDECSDFWESDSES